MGKDIFLSLILSCSLVLPTGAQQVRLAPSPIPSWPPPADYLETHPDQYVFFDALAQEWVVTFPDTQGVQQDDPRTELRFSSHAEVKPVISVHVEKSGKGGFDYTYTLQNGLGARTPLAKWTLLVPVGDDRFTATHGSWRATRNESGNPRVLNPGARRLAELHWSPPTMNGSLPPGSGASGFSVHSAFAPGFSTIAAKGRVAREYDPAVASQLPKAAADQLARVLEPAFDSARQLVIGPWFAPDADLATIAMNFQYGIRLLSDQQLLNSESAFVKGALAVFDNFLASDAATELDPSRMEFLSAATPGLETEIANAIRLALTP
jgi:hypothetical protein